MQTSGMIIRPDFHLPLISIGAPERQAAARSDRPTGIVIFGGQRIEGDAEALPSGRRLRSSL